MLNIVWPIFIIISIIYAIFTGRVEQINSSIFESTSTAVEVAITFFGTITLWSGIMKIAQKTTLIEGLTKLLSPVIRILFPKIEKNDPVYKEISMNMVANILGLGNAATPLGIKAMKTMQKNNTNKSVLTDEMAMFIVINTASIQLIPTTVIAIRESLKSQNSTMIIVPVWIATISAAITGIIMAKILSKKY